ncbi:E3 ubiquitin-protein ligase RMND5A [Geodia barretti]|nr:E3 ubiquitin-protein ligase RMND5A [Geodia barretti]
MHATISKLGKAIDKNFSADISAMNVDGAFSGQPCLELNRVICEHLFRQGKMEVGETLMKEAELELDQSYLGQFTELNLVLEALRSRNVEPALE